MFTRLGEKNLATLHELVPKAVVIGALVNPNNPNAEPQTRDLQAAARMLGLQLVILAAGSERDIDGVFATLRERRIEALLVTADGFFFGLPDKLATLAARHAVPTFYPLSDYVAAGGLISYGANLSESWRHAPPCALSGAVLVRSNLTVQSGWSGAFVVGNMLGAGRCGVESRKARRATIS